MRHDVHSPADPFSSGGSRRGERALSLAAWTVALILVVIAINLGLRSTARPPFLESDPSVPQELPISGKIAPGVQQTLQTPGLSISPGLMPEFKKTDQLLSVQRRLTWHTVFPNRPRREVLDYTVAQGDSVFEIAARFKITPESVLWGNYEQLNDNPDLIAVGMELVIPPVDGVLYKWQDGDTLEAVAGRFDAKLADILNWPGNNLDLTAPQIAAGALIMIPGGHREFRQWLIPTIPRGSAGVSSSLYGGGACEGGYEGAYGTGAFIWPAGNHILSGNDYWSGHLGIDIAAGDGAPIYAADSGVVVFSGWANGGYGYTVMIDHGNGYQTLYAHLSSASVNCGRSVLQGGTIGFAGSTGNSTGTHLHFEVRYQGGFISPWYVLPAP